MKIEDPERMYIKHILEGDDSFFTYFINTYKDMAYTLAMSIVKSDDIAKEVVQDAFLKAYQALSSFKMDAVFRTWFYRITVNEGLMRYKKMKKESISLQSYYDQSFQDLYTSAETEESQEIDNMKIALLKLPPKESLVIRLYYLEEQNIKTLCLITGMSPSNVKIILFRARKNLYQIMGNTEKNK
jgi:RNA polymerase sigma factor (sigma-70 family)